MSYECCKRITLDKKKNKIKVCVASNNVIPKTYTTCEIFNNRDYSFEDKLLFLFVELQSGNIQISTINDNTKDFEYAMWKVREYLKENNIDSYDDLYTKKNKLIKDRRYKLANIQRSNLENENDREYADYCSYKKWADSQDEKYVRQVEDEIVKEVKYEVYGKCFEIFKNALYEEFDGNYKIVFNGDYVLTRLGRYNRGYDRFSYTSYGRFLELDYKRAYIVKKDFSNRDLEIVKV